MGGEFFEFKVWRLQHFGERIAEKIRILAVIKSEAHFVKIGGEMLRVHFMPCPNDAALEQREGRFHGVCVNVAVSVLSGVIDRAMLVSLHFVEREGIDRRFIRHNHFDVASKVLVNDFPDRCGLGIGGANKSEIPISLSNANYYLLATLCSPPAFLAAYVGFVYLDGASEWLGRYFHHRCANPMAEIPRRLIARVKRALQLQSRHTLFGFAHQVDSSEPFGQRQVRIMEDRSGGYGELVAA